MEELREMEDRLSYTIRTVDDVTVIDLIGELDMYTLPLAQELLNTLLSDKRNKITFNLAKLRYVDSSGLGYFTGTLKNLRQRGGDMNLVNLSSYISRIFSLIHLDYFIDVYESTREAVESFKEATEKAIANHRKAVEMNRGYPDAHYKLGRAYLDKGDYEKAVQELLQAIEFNAEYTEAYLALGRAYKARALLKEAEENLIIALKLDPRCAETLAELGMLYGDRKMLVEAEEKYRAAIGINPGYADYHSKLAELLAIQGKKVEAVKELREALTINPNYIRARLLLGQTLMDLGQEDEGRTTLKRVIDGAYDEDIRRKAKELMG